MEITKSLGTNVNFMSVQQRPLLIGLQFAFSHWRVDISKKLILHIAISAWRMQREFGRL